MKRSEMRSLYDKKTNEVKASVEELRAENQRINALYDVRAGEKDVLVTEITRLSMLNGNLTDGLAKAMAKNSAMVDEIVRLNKRLDAARTSVAEVASQISADTAPPSPDAAHPA